MKKERNSALQPFWKPSAYSWRSWRLGPAHSTKFSLCVVLGELAAQVRVMRLRVDVWWTPRERNQEVDDVSNGLTSSFSPELEVRRNLAAVPWIVLPRLLAIGLEILKQRVEALEAKRKDVRGQAAFPLAMGMDSNRRRWSAAACRLPSLLLPPLACCCRLLGLEGGRAPEAIQVRARSCRKWTVSMFAHAWKKKRTSEFTCT